MTITGGSALPKEEIDRMVKEAEAHAAEDAKRKEEAELRNTSEQQVYSIEKLLEENKGKLDDSLVSEVQGAVDTLKTALEGEDIEAIKTAQQDLTTKSQKIGEAVYAQAQADAQAGEAPAGDQQATEDDDIVDAEIVDDEEDGSK